MFGPSVWQREHCSINLVSPAWISAGLASLLRGYLDRELANGSPVIEKTVAANTLLGRIGHPDEMPMATQDSLSLYERLGGVYSIATVLDDFIDRIMIDPRLNANPRVDEAHHRVPPAVFKYLVTEMLCWAAGGPQKYTGRAMKESHQHLIENGDRVGSLSRRSPANP
jgi:hypothetical protein